MYWYFFSLFPLFWILHVFLPFHVSHSFVSRQVPTNHPKEGPEGSTPTQRKEGKGPPLCCKVHHFPVWFITWLREIFSFFSSHPNHRKDGGRARATPTKSGDEKPAPPKRGNITPKKDWNVGPLKAAEERRQRRQHRAIQEEENSNNTTQRKKATPPKGGRSMQHDAKRGGGETAPHTRKRKRKQHRPRGGNSTTPKEEEAYERTRRKTASPRGGGTDRKRKRKQSRTMTKTRFKDPSNNDT